MTNDLLRRVYEHRTRIVPGFTSRYNLERLVYFEEHHEAIAAIQREKNVKHWPRKWKVALLEEGNPEWRDLYPEIAHP